MAAGATTPQGKARKRKRILTAEGTQRIQRKKNKSLTVSNFAKAGGLQSTEKR